MKTNAIRSALMLATKMARLFTIAALTVTTATGAAMVTAVDWQTENLGAIGPVSVTMSNISTPFDDILTYHNLSNSNFSAAPLPAGSETIEYAENSNWTATFGAPVEGLLLYLASWRGNQTTGIDAPSTYTFDRPFTILSGLQGVAKTGNTLTISESVAYAFGIVQFSGSVSSLSVVANIPLNDRNAQALTFAAPVPEPSTAALWCLAGLFSFRRGRKTAHNFRGPNL